MRRRNSIEACGDVTVQHVLARNRFFKISEDVDVDVDEVSSVVSYVGSVSNFYVFRLQSSKSCRRVDLVDHPMCINL